MPYADPEREKEHHVNYYQENKEHLKKRSRQRYASLSKKGKKEWYEKCQEWNKKHPEKVKESKKKWADNPKNKIGRRAYKRQYVLENKKLVSQKNKQYREENVVHIQEYRKKPHVKARFAESKSRYKIQKSRTSKFELNNAKSIVKLYELAGKKIIETGRQYHVDHIIPLRGKSVTGFNVAGNLRVMLAHTNHTKNNRYTARDEALIQRRMVKDWIANGVDFNLKMSE